jgi:hypothetical protein
MTARAQAVSIDHGTRPFPRVEAFTLAVACE